MSVINPPRIYFQGFMEWDPNTCNNNKWLLQWDVDTSELNWAELNKFGITWQNFQATFPDWASTLSPKGDYPCQSDPIAPGEQPALWDFFGGNGCDFVNNNRLSTTISGGVLPNGQAVSVDPLIGNPISLKGNPFNGHPTQARLVDLDAASTLTSQIWFDSLQVGSDATPAINGQRLDIMQSRLINGSRNMTYSEQAGGAACLWQCTIPNANLNFDQSVLDQSPLLQAIAQGASNAEGIMLRFCTYLTLYYKNGIYNDISVQPRNATDIAGYYEQVFAGSLPVFSNPAYSRTVGSIGVWESDDMQNAPSERTLFASHSIDYQLNKTTPPLALKTMYKSHAAEVAVGAAKSISLGPILCDFSFDANGNSTHAHLDLSSTFPEIDASDPLNPTKFNFGAFNFGVESGGQYYQLAVIDYAQYNDNQYLQSSGMLDVSTAPVSQSVIDSGVLQLQLASGGDAVCTESPNRLQTDSRGVYLDQGKASAPINIRLQVRGKPAANQLVRVIRYAADPSVEHTAMCEGYKNLLPVTTNGIQTIEFVSGYNTQTLDVAGSSTDKAEIAVLTTDSQGNASIAVKAVNPGYCYLAFYADALTEVPNGYSIGTLLQGEYGVVRVMPYDDGLQQQFVDLWNGSAGNTPYDPDQVWEFVYNKILYFYDMIYPVMQRYVPLGDKTRMEGAVDQLQVTLSEAYMQDFSTMMMPITRDLSSAKRWVLLTWCELVKSNYQPIDLPPYTASLT